MDKQIVVPTTAIPATVGTLLRYVLTFVGGLMVTKGILPVDSDVEQIAGIALVVISTAYGVWKSKKNTNAMQKMEPYAPNSVAVSAANAK